MAVSFKLLLLDHHWKKDGSNYFRVRITHQRQSKYLKTNIIVDRKDVTKGGRIRNPEISNACYELQRKIRNAINGLDVFEVESMSVDQVVEKIKGVLKKKDGFRLNFTEFGREVAKRKSIGARAGYLVAMNALERFFGRHLDIAEITVRNLRSFETFLQNENVVRKVWQTGEIKKTAKAKGARAVSLYISCVRHIYRMARLEFNDPDLGLFPIPNDPFEYYSVPKSPASKHRDISIESIQFLIDTRKQLTGPQKMVIDVFLISFGLCGMNAVDLFNCNKPNGDILHYCRQKTAQRRSDGARMWVKIPKRIQGIMDEYRDNERCFDFHRRYSSAKAFNQAISSNLRRFIKRYNLEPFDFYAARHSWATIGRSKKCNIDKSIITAGLCHVDTASKVDDIYIKFDWETLWDAQEKILDLFDW